MSFPFETHRLITSLRESYLAIADDNGYASSMIRGSGPFDAKTTDSDRSGLSESPPITFQRARYGQTIKYESRGSNTEPRKRRKSRRIEKKPKELSQLPEVEEESRERNGDSVITTPDFTGPNSPAEDSSKHNEGIYSPSGQLYEDSTSEGSSNEEMAQEASANGHTHQKDAHSNGFGISYSKTIRGRKITRFFSKKSDSDSDGSNKTSTLDDNNMSLIAEAPHEGELTDDGDITETESVRKDRHKSSRRGHFDSSDVVTIDSDFGVPIDANGQVVHNALPEEQHSPNSIDPDTSADDLAKSLEDATVDDEYDSYYSEEDIDDTSSTDSAFTDIETDSILDSSLMMDPYKGAESYPFAADEEPSPSADFKIDKKRRRKTFKPETKAVPYKQSQPRSISFDKIDPTTKTHAESNLSYLIQSKFKTTSLNPLSYYSFADPKFAESSRVRINLFIPPSSKCQAELQISENVPIVDVIGYILLELSSTIPEYTQMSNDPSFLNPNNWRIELVDEDGENYGSFGILDRTRVLSSYNSPRDLALCKVVDAAEIQKNEAQSPLPLDFKQRVLALEKRSSIDQVLGDIRKSSIGGRFTQLKILAKQLNGPYTTTMFSTDSSYTMAQVVQDYCLQQGLSPGKYRFREVLYSKLTDVADSQITSTGNFQSDTFQLGNMNSTSSSVLLPGVAIGTQTKALKDSDLVSQLAFNTVELCVAGIYDSPTLNEHITPAESAFAITPERRNLEDKIQQLALVDTTGVPPEAKPRVSTAENLRREITSRKYLDDIMTGKNPSLSANLNTVYFKWKVTRKKTTILNKIEKCLVLDGDYIHLTPSDDIVLTDNPFDNPFASQTQHNNSTNNHHHHHLYHYNYNNYYKESMMKTSSFHITQITKLKQYKDSKNPNHFKIVIRKQESGAPTNKEAVKKKYDLEAVSVSECQEIIDKLNWVMQVYASNALTNRV